MGYSNRQIRDLEATIRNADSDVVVPGTPHDLARLIDVAVPVVRSGTNSRRRTSRSGRYSTATQRRWAASR